MKTWHLGIGSAQGAYHWWLGIHVLFKMKVLENLIESATSHDSVRICLIESISKRCFQNQWHHVQDEYGVLQGTVYPILLCHLNINSGIEHLKKGN